MAERTWKQLRIATTGDRVPIDEVFGCYRAGPDGESPRGGRRFTGIIIGQACAGGRWTISWSIVSLVSSVSNRQLIRGGLRRPSGPALARDEERGRLIWGWSDADLMRWNQELEVRASTPSPSRLRRIASAPWPEA